MFFFLPFIDFFSFFLDFQYFSFSGFYDVGASYKAYSLSVLFVHSHHQTNLIYYYVAFIFVVSLRLLELFHSLYRSNIQLDHHMVFLYGFQVFFSENCFVFKFLCRFWSLQFIYIVSVLCPQFSFFFSLDILARTSDSIQ